MWSIYTLDFSVIKKRNKQLISTTIWKNLKHIMLSERKPGTEDYILYDSSYRKCAEKAKQTGGCQALSRWGNGHDY